MKQFPEHLQTIPGLQGVYQETVALDQPFELVAQPFAEDKGSILLLSGAGLDCSQYNILAIDPWMTITSRQDTICLEYQNQQLTFKAEPLTVVEALLQKYRLDDDVLDSRSCLPVMAGLFGYLSYDLKDQIETLPRTCTDTNLPDMCFYLPSVILIQEIETNETTLCIPLQDNESADRIIQEKRSFFFERVSQAQEKKTFSIDSKGFRSSLTKTEYIEAIKSIIDYLKAGDIYQANLSQRFETGFSGDPYSLFLDLFERNPASFFSYINAGDHYIVSTSPERFIKQDGTYVETRPIKGTTARGSTTEQDREKGKKLTTSVKDDAELTMIVDLMRNDLSRVTRHESVIVKEHKRLEPYDNVFHLVSIVEGQLKDGKNSVDLIRATFPGGSITGCPKIRSMEIIDELEPVKRHVYTGSIGYISFHDTMDLSIAIRTATVVNNTVFFSVGGGIVYDSDPEKEFQETLDKGKTLIDSLSGVSSKRESRKTKAWIDGKFINQDKAVVPAVSAGFQYGAGLFETLCVKQGRIYRLEDHLQRLSSSWRSLFSIPFPDVTWKDVIAHLIRVNNFEEKTLAVKLLIAKDERDNGKKVLLAAFAREYIHRLELLGKKGVDVVTYPYPRQTPLADQKTMNYLYYERAGHYARERGGDEALILNPDLTVSETNTANIFSVKGKTVFVPESAHALAGVTLKNVLKILSDKGYDICRQHISKEEFYSFPNIILTNALMGAVKVLTIDQKSIKQEYDICSMINKELFDI